MKTMLICLAFAFSLKAVCADNLEYAIVSGVESLQRVRTASSLFPWDRAAPGEVLVSLSCGFARVVYARVTTPGFARLNDDPNPKPWKVLVQLGHYCKLNEFVLDGWHLVAYRTWKGQDYLITFAEIRVGEDERLYVDDPDFLEETGLGDHSVPAAGTADSTDCAQPGPDCPLRRVYVDTIPMQANKSTQRARETPPADQPTPACSDLAGKVVSLRGKISRKHDHMSPDADFGDALVIDPMEDVLLMTLPRPLCAIDSESSNRPVVESGVTIIELSPRTAREWNAIRRHVGHEKIIEGTLSENVWWHYEATLKMDVQRVR